MESDGLSEFPWTPLETSPFPQVSGLDIIANSETSSSTTPLNLNLDLNPCLGMQQLSILIPSSPYYIAAAPNQACHRNDACNCDDIILEQLRQTISSGEQRSSLLKSLLALGSNVKTLDTLSRCTSCMSKPKAIVTLLVLAETITSHLHQLDASLHKSMTYNITIRLKIGTGGIAAESREAYMSILTDLFQYHIQRLDNILRSLIYKANSAGWLDQVATLDSLRANI